MGLHPPRSSSSLCTLHGQHLNTISVLSASLGSKYFKGLCLFHLLELSLGVFFFSTVDLHFHTCSLLKCFKCRQGAHRWSPSHWTVGGRGETAPCLPSRKCSADPDPEAQGAQELHVGEEGTLFSTFIFLFVILGLPHAGITAAGITSG